MILLFNYSKNFICYFQFVFFGVIKKLDNFILLLDSFMKSFFYRAKKKEKIIQNFLFL